MLSSTTPFVLANWKMNLGLRESVSLARVLARQFKRLKLKDKVELGLVPTFPALSAVASVLKRSGIGLGAQDVFWKGTGPYTGEVSPALLHELGVRYVIVGHSERRQYLKETDAMVRQKVLASLAYGLTPVLCVGETLAERNAGLTETIVAQQVSDGLRGVTLTATARLIIAYEPVWVIGSGKAVAPEDAFSTARVIKQCLRQVLPTAQATRQVCIIYGGSVDPSNIRTFVGHGLLQGVLVGGASLDARRLVALLKQL